jgi:hypothetical protein
LGILQALTFADGHVIRTEDVPLGANCHLSYPFTWAENGRVLCLPEMAGSRRQMMYELVTGGVPRPLCVIAEDTAMADATLFQHGGLYWIAYTDTEIGLHDNLCLLWSDRLEGPWTSHRSNPVKIDVRSSRCGGGLFRVRDWLVRPAQDCSRTYGGSLVLNRVVECTRDSYSEEPVATLLPDQTGRYRHGLHTLSFGADTILIDGKRWVVDPAIILQRIRRRLSPYLRPRVHLGLNDG